MHCDRRHCDFPIQSVACCMQMHLLSEFEMQPESIASLEMAPLEYTNIALGQAHNTLPYLLSMLHLPALNVMRAGSAAVLLCWDWLFAAVSCCILLNSIDHQRCRR